MNMYNYINQFYNKKTAGTVSGRTFYSLSFALIVPLGLGLDSVYFAEHYFDGRWVLNAIAFFSFFAMLRVSNTRLRKLMIMMVPLGLIGEIVFSTLCGLYDYRLGHIPLYVPFGHAIVYGSGYMFHGSRWAQANNEIMKKVFFVFFVSIFAIAGIFYFDVFSIILGFMFFYRGLRRKQWNTLYYYIAIYVLIIEFAGTYFEVWQWEELAFGFIPTANPPVGAVYLYLGGDSVLLRIMRVMDKYKILTPLDGKRPEENW